MALTWAGVITILFLAAACVRGYRRDFAPDYA